MKKKAQVSHVTQVRVENYQTESTNMPLALLVGIKAPVTPATPTALYLRSIPKELADILETKVMSAMIGQSEYQQFLSILKTV